MAHILSLRMWLTIQVVVLDKQFQHTSAEGDLRTSANGNAKVFQDLYLQDLVGSNLQKQPYKFPKNNVDPC